MKPLVLFGGGKIAEVLLHYFREQGELEVVACCVDRPFVAGPKWNGLPMLAFDEVPALYPPQTHDMFVALGYQGMNELRQARCAQARDLGYRLASFVHRQSGLPRDCSFGDNCFFMNNVLVHPCVSFGDNVFVWSGAMVGHHSHVGDNCWLTSSAQIAGDVTVGANCFFAINATVGHGIVMGARCFVGANALVTQSTKDGQVFVTPSTQPFRLNSAQFMRMTRLADL